jgi:glutaredoxin
MIKIYSLPDCPRCEEIKDKLRICGYEYEELPMDSAESITEMRVNGCFAMEAPVCEYEGIFYEYCHCNADGFFSELLGMKCDQVEVAEIQETHGTLSSTGKL